MMSAAILRMVTGKAVPLAAMLLFFAFTISAGTSYAESVSRVVVEKVRPGYVLAGGITFKVSESTQILNRWDDRISIKMLQPESIVNINYKTTGKKTATATRIKIVKDPPG